MALLSVIRRWHFREGMPIREIERRTGLSRNTIRKYPRDRKRQLPLQGQQRRSPKMTKGKTSHLTHNPHRGT
jgi:transposase